MLVRVPLAAWGLLVLLLSPQGVQGQDTEAPPAEPGQAPGAPGAPGGEEDGDWGMDSLRGGFEAVNSYFDSMLELMGGRDGVCQYRCRYGEWTSLLILQFNVCTSHNHSLKGLSRPCVYDPRP